MVRGITIAFSLIVSVAAPPAYADTFNKETLARTLVKMSGLEQRIRQIPPQVLSELAEQQGKMPAELYKTIVPVFQDAYNAERLATNVSKQIESNLDTETMRYATAWLQSGLGKKIRRLREAETAPQAVQHMQVFAQQLQVSWPAQRRLELAQRLDTATNSTEMSVNVTEATVMGVATALDAIRPKCRQVGVERMQKQMEHQRPHRRQVHRQAATVSFLDVYQTLSDAELEWYLDFLESKGGRTYQMVVGEALRSALIDAAHNAERTSAAAMKQPLRGAGSPVNMCEKMIRAAASSTSAPALTQLAYCAPW